MEHINLAELEAAALAALPVMARDYYASGARDEITLADNRRAWDRVRLHYRVLVDVSRRDPSTTVLGTPVSMPVLIAPTAFHKLAHPDGELATARAAAAMGTVMACSTLGTVAVGELAPAGGPLWFQLYVYRDRAITEGLVRRAEAAGCRALVLTVDAAEIGTRERDLRNRFALPPGLSVANLDGTDKAALAAADGSGLAAYVRAQLDQSLTWKDLEWLVGLTRLPVLVKGIVRADDARRAIAAGAAGVVVSNHGGRQLDTAPATADVLPRVADAVAGAAEVYVDGGIRRGTDVIKALALGARAVLVGRPILWGLAVGGEAGVRHVLSLLRAELLEAMALCGCADLAACTRDLVEGG
ncbi:MAG: alpha-hydroxy acid oxidase [bacterium]